MELNKVALGLARQTNAQRCSIIKSNSAGRSLSNQAGDYPAKHDAYRTTNRDSK